VSCSAYGAKIMPVVKIEDFGKMLSCSAYCSCSVFDKVFGKMLSCSAYRNSGGFYLGPVGSRPAMYKDFGKMSSCSAFRFNGVLNKVFALLKLALPKLALLLGVSCSAYSASSDSYIAASFLDASCSAYSALSGFDYYDHYDYYGFHAYGAKSTLYTAADSFGVFCSAYRTNGVKYANRYVERFVKPFAKFMLVSDSDMLGTYSGYRSLCGSNANMSGPARPSHCKDSYYHHFVNDPIKKGPAKSLTKSLALGSKGGRA
jgi:hypothetical protein